jgi:hypothetical protein
VSGGDLLATRRPLGGASLTLGDDMPVGLDQLSDLLRGATWVKH